MARHLCTLLERTEFCSNYKGHFFFSSHTLVRRPLIGTTHSALPLPWWAYTKNGVSRIIGFANKRASSDKAMFPFYLKSFLQKKHLKSCPFKPKNVKIVSVVQARAGSIRMCEENGVMVHSHCMGTGTGPVQETGTIGDHGSGPVPVWTVLHNIPIVPCLIPNSTPSPAQCDRAFSEFLTNFLRS